MAIGQELLNVPMGDMIRQMATAIADGQMQLDATSIEVAEMMGGLKVIHGGDGTPTFDDSRIFFGFETLTVAAAQAALAADEAFTGGDANALTKFVNDQIKAAQPGEIDQAIIRVPTRLSMLELGFSPTFYQFVDTIIEVKIAIKITRETQSTVARRNTVTANRSASRGGGLLGLFGGRKSNESTVTTSQVDATYSSKFSYSAEGASLLRTKLVPIPPPPILEERIRRQMDEDAARRARLAAPAGGGQ